MDIDDILASVDQPDISSPESTALDHQLLTRFWVAERGVPELLPWPGPLMDRTMDRVRRQVSRQPCQNTQKYTKELTRKPGRNNRNPSLNTHHHQHAQPNPKPQTINPPNRPLANPVPPPLDPAATTLQINKIQHALPPPNLRTTTSTPKLAIQLAIHPTKPRATCTPRTNPPNPRPLSRPDKNLPTIPPRSTIPARPPNPPRVALRDDLPKRLPGAAETAGRQRRRDEHGAAAGESGGCVRAVSCWGGEGCGAAGGWCGGGVGGGCDADGRCLGCAVGGGEGCLGTGGGGGFITFLWGFLNYDMFNVALISVVHWEALGLYCTKSNA